MKIPCYLSAFLNDTLDQDDLLIFLEAIINAEK